MVASIPHALARIKEGWDREFSDEVVAEACIQNGHTWRDRLFSPMFTIRVFLLQVLYGNTACEHLPHLARKSFSAQAYCKARKRLPLAVLQQLLERTVTRLGQQALDTGRWLGHRVFLVDGSSFSMPDTDALRAKFGLPANQKPGCGFPVAHWLAKMHGASLLITKLVAAPLRTNDPRLLPEIHPELQPGDVLVGDSMFCSFAHFAVLLARGVQGLFPPHTQIVDFTPGRLYANQRGSRPNQKGLPRSRWLKCLGTNDQLVEWFRPVVRPAWFSEEQFAQLPATITLRELRYQVEQKGFRVREVTVITTLLDPSLYPATALADLYFKRWQIETSFRHIKTTMRMDVLHCKTVEGVLKELTMFALVYNLVRLTMHETAKRQGVPEQRISFIDALRWLMHATPDGKSPTLHVNLLRRNRSEPRVVKRRPKKFQWMTKPRDQMRKAMEQPALTT